MGDAAKADSLMEEGEKQLTKFAPFTSSDEKRDKAREKFLQAATQYKAVTNWLRAAAAYQRASDMSSKSKSESDFVSDCEDAAKCFRKAKDRRSTELFEKVVDMYAQQQRYSQAAKYCLTIAEDSEGQEALSWMQKAVRYHRSDNSKVTANEVVVKMADTYLKIGDYDEARKIFDKQARDALDDRLSRGGARKLFFNALLCQLAQLTPTNMSESLGSLVERFEEYQELDNQFNEHTREHIFIADIIKAIEAQDIEAFETAVSEYDEIVPLDEKKMKLVLKAKQALRNSDLR
jgi:alpha-soluble NSF attachment protein